MSAPAVPRARTAPGPAPSPNLALDEEVGRRRARGDRIVHLGFGEARLPLLPSLADALAAGATWTSYGPVAGRAEVRTAVAGYFDRRGLPTAPDRVVLGPGSKPLLFATAVALGGDVVVPRPAWNSYAPQIRLAGHRPVPVDIPPECGGVPDPALLAATLAAATAAGRCPVALVVTCPDNPTGTLAGPDRLREVCAVAERFGLTVVADEIYRDLVHDPATPLLSAAAVLPERTVVSTGVSKTLGLGGWRIGALRFPPGPLGDRLQAAVTSVASDVWSGLAGPMQAAAAYAFADPPDVRTRVRAAAGMHGRLARAVHEIVVARGALARPPTAGFYVYPDLEPRRAALARSGVHDAASLQARLLDRYGVAVLSGHHLGDRPELLRFKTATSVLAGESAAEQLQALQADDPAALPHIRPCLDRLAAALDDLTT